MLQKKTLVQGLLLDRSYQNDKIFIASHTQAHIIGRQVGEKGQPSFDISKVCCWMCEKPLRSRFELCHVPREGDISLISEPDSAISYDSEAEMVDDDQFVKSWNSKIQFEDTILLCGDCSESIKYSFVVHPEIRDNNGDRVENLRSCSHYIWPNLEYKIVGDRVDILTPGSLEVLVNKANDVEVFTSEQCFIYEKKVAWVKYLSMEENGVERLVQEEFESRLFIEPNPNVPKVLQIFARNTIRLFRLNGVHYFHGEEHHEIHYDVSKSHTKFDGLRLVGRNKAYNRSRTALDQFRTAREFDQGLYSVLLDQQKLIMELNGYYSVWASVFKDGNDPGGLSDIFGTDPLPTSPVSSGPKSPDKVDLMKKEILDLRQDKRQIAIQLQTKINRLIDDNNSLRKQNNEIRLQMNAFQDFLTHFLEPDTDDEEVEEEGKGEQVTINVDDEEDFKPVQKRPRVEVSDGNEEILIEKALSYSNFNQSSSYMKSTLPPELGNAIKFLK